MGPLLSLRHGYDGFLPGSLPRATLTTFLWVRYLFNECGKTGMCRGKGYTGNQGDQTETTETRPRILSAEEAKPIYDGIKLTLNFSGIGRPVGMVLDVVEFGDHYRSGNQEGMAATSGGMAMAEGATRLLFKGYGEVGKVIGGVYGWAAEKFLGWGFDQNKPQAPISCKAAKC
jgi:hypothetical protein